MEVALAIVPRMLRSAMDQGTPTIQLSEAEELLIDQANPVRPKLDGHHPTCTYLIANGNRVKIGITSNLGRRLTSLTMYPSDVRLLLRGGRRLEAALHRRFADFRIGHSEWFDEAPAVTDFITEKLRHPALPLATPPSAMGRSVPTSCAEVDISAEELLNLARTCLADSNRAVHLSTILARLQADGAPTGWTTVDLRAAYARVGVPVRRAVRANGRVSPGIHRDDIRHL